MIGEATSRPAAYYDGKAHIITLAYAVQLYAQRASQRAELGSQIDEKLCELGYERALCREDYSDEVPQLLMLYRTRR